MANTVLGSMVCKNASSAPSVQLHTSAVLSDLHGTRGAGLLRHFQLSKSEILGGKGDDERVGAGMRALLT